LGRWDYVPGYYFLEFTNTDAAILRNQIKKISYYVYCRVNSKMELCTGTGSFSGRTGASIKVNLRRVSGMATGFILPPRAILMRGIGTMGFRRERVACGKWLYDIWLIFRIFEARSVVNGGIFMANSCQV